MLNTVFTTGLRNAEANDLVLYKEGAEYVLAYVRFKDNTQHRFDKEGHETIVVEKNKTNLRTGAHISAKTLPSIDYPKALLLLSTVPSFFRRIVEKDEAEDYLVVHRDYAWESANAEKVPELQVGQVIYFLNPDFQRTHAEVSRIDDKYVYTWMRRLLKTEYNVTWSLDADVIDQMEEFLQYA